MAGVQAGADVASAWGWAAAGAEGDPHALNWEVSAALGELFAVKVRGTCEFQIRPCQPHMRAGLLHLEGRALSP